MCTIARLLESHTTILWCNNIYIICKYKVFQVLLNHDFWQSTLDGKFSEISEIEENSPFLSNVYHCEAIGQSCNTFYGMCCNSCSIASDISVAAATYNSKGAPELSPGLMGSGANIRFNTFLINIGWNLSHQMPNSPH